MGMAMIATHFPGLDLSETRLEVWRRALNELSNEEFERGVRKFCLEHSEIYPGTNVIAHIRNYALGKRHRDYRAEAFLIWHLYTSGQALPDYVHHENMVKAYELTMRASTGLVDDRLWDEKRFCDIYVGLMGGES